MGKMEKSVSFREPYVDKQYIYAASHFYNAFVRINKSDYSIEHIGILKGFQQNWAWKIHSIYRYNNKLFLFSQHSYETAVYDMDKKEFEYFSPEIHNISIDNVRTVCRVGSKVWIFREAPESLICIFSMEDCTYSFYEQDMSLFDKYVSKEEYQNVTEENSWLIGDKIWRCFQGTNVIYGTDIHDYSLSIIQLPVKAALFDISYDGGNHFLFTEIQGSRILKWNMESQVIEQQQFEEEGLRIYKKVVYAKGKTIILPCLSREHILVWSDDQIQNIPIFQEGLTFNSRGLFLSWHIENSILYLFPCGCDRLIELDLDTLELSYKKLIFNDLNYILDSVSSLDKVEDSECTLDNFISLVRSR